jgi:hypothetical protein
VPVCPSTSCKWQRSPSEAAAARSRMLASPAEAVVAGQEAGVLDETEANGTRQALPQLGLHVCLCVCIPRISLSCAFMQAPRVSAPRLAALGMRTGVQRKSTQTRL